MENFPTEIIKNILFRLPIEVALRAKCVCTTWEALLRNYKSSKVGFLFALSLSVKRGSSDTVRQELFYEDEYDHYHHANINYYHTGKTLSKIEHGRCITKSSQRRIGMLGSCNGLACFGKFGKYDELDGADPFVICNPLTGESIFLPEIDYSELHEDLPSTRFPFNSLLTSGFGYCPSTDEYKVVRICYPLEELKGYVHVYTIGYGWRFIGFIGNHIFTYSIGIYANGALYWLHQSVDEEEKYEIVAFDLEDEKFSWIPLPCSQNVEYESRFCFPRRILLGGNNNLYVAFTNYTASPADNTAIWVYKSNNINADDTSYATEECNQEQINDHNESSSCWIKEFSIEQKGDYSDFEPFAITKNNEVLLWYKRLIPSRTTLCCYDPITSTLNKLWDDYAESVDSVECIEAIPHTPSLVSLKELGETDVTYLKDLEKHLSQADLKDFGHEYIPIPTTEDEEDFGHTVCFAERTIT